MDDKPLPSYIPVYPFEGIDWQIVDSFDFFIDLLNKVFTERPGLKFNNSDEFGDYSKAYETAFDQLLLHDIHTTAIRLWRIDKAKIPSPPDEPIKFDFEYLKVMKNWAVKGSSQQCMVSNQSPGEIEKYEKNSIKKKSTNSGEARVKIIAALTQHHQYDDGMIGNYAPIGVNALKRLASVGSNSTVSKFFTDEFGSEPDTKKSTQTGHPIYLAICINPERHAKLRVWLMK